MMTVMQTARLITWVIVGLVVLANILYWLGPATLRTEELAVIGLLIIGLIWFQVLLRRRSVESEKPKAPAVKREAEEDWGR
jgi:F0F1-type ATP synthase assembly protein I